MMIELLRPRALSSPAQLGLWVPTPGPSETAGAPGTQVVPCHTPKLVRMSCCAHV